MSDAEQSTDSEDESFETLLEDATERLGRLEERLGGIEAIDELAEDEIEAIVGDVDALATVLQEVAELVDAIDLSELPEAIDAGELVDAIELGEIPDALADDEEGDVVKLRQLVDAIDLLDAWDATDLTDVWEETRELDDAMDALGDGEDAGMIEDAVSDLADEDGGLLGGDEDDEGLIDGDEWVDSDMDPVEGAKEALGKPDVAEDPEAYQVFIQEQAMKGLDAFREALLEVNAKFERLYEINRQKMRDLDRRPSSRNPTAVSTIQSDRRDLGGGTRHATVPQQVKLSTAPSRRRIYGRRFEIERRKRKEDTDDD
ncbi:hypothetical protein [Halosolutus gelatinilyticus]|uniref:hypothetical protein n=1 Tax=Halosolutus gelatinilyticus TaxID=2931975 RepID=UPI001FF127A5|nr:hypothetical protein [Halosolutus gelatinilyticus]